MLSGHEFRVLFLRRLCEVFLSQVVQNFVLLEIPSVVDSVPASERFLDLHLFDEVFHAVEMTEADGLTKSQDL